MPAYDRDYDPPAPVADVTVANPVTGVMTGLKRGKLDTGAALTVIPQRTVADLALSRHGDVWARGYEGSYTLRALYFVRFILEGHDLALVQCLAVDRETVLVGRNVLNQFVITLDGKNLRFELKRA